MLRRFTPCALRAATEAPQPRCGFSTNIDFSHEKPAPCQLEHVQQRLVETVPLMFKQRLDYTFYRKDVLCDDQIFGLQKHGLDELVRHLGMISVLGQIILPHVEMEAVSVIPVIEDGTVRCRWRVKYISFPRLLLNPQLFKFEYRLKNLSWYDGYSVLTIDGNGQVLKITIQKVRRDEEMLLDGKSNGEMTKKIALLRPSPAASHYMPQQHAKFKSNGTC